MMLPAQCPVCGLTTLAVKGRLSCCTASPATAKPAEPCIHRGEEIRQQECPTCCGNVRVKVFSCEVHGECTIASSIEDTQSCQGCDDYTLVRRKRKKKKK